MRYAWVWVFVSQFISLYIFCICRCLSVRLWNRLQMNGMSESESENTTYMHHILALIALLMCALQWLTNWLILLSNCKCISSHSPSQSQTHTWETKLNGSDCVSACVEWLVLNAMHTYWQSTKPQPVLYTHINWQSCWRRVHTITYDGNPIDGIVEWFFLLFIWKRSISFGDPSYLPMHIHGLSH